METSNNSLNFKQLFFRNLFPNTGTLFTQLQIINKRKEDAKTEKREKNTKQE